MTPNDSENEQGSVLQSSRGEGQRLRVCMVTYSYYESDNRVRRYAETLAERGDEVEVFSIRRCPESPRAQLMNGVRVFRIQNRFSKEEKTRFSFLRPLLRFLVASSCGILNRHRRKPYDLVHVHNIPDFMVFAAWYPKMRGAKVILDIHDIVPELFSNKFGAANGSPLVYAMKLVERVSAAFADHVIISNHLWFDQFTSRSASPGKCSVLINHVDEKIFHARQEKSRDKGDQVILFPGGLQWHQGLDVAIRAFEKLQRRLQGTKFHIYGDGIMKAELEALVEQLNLTGKVCFFPFVGMDEIADVMANADLGVVPKRADSFGNAAYSTKIMEFMAVGVPVVVSKTRVDQYYFNDSVVRFFESGNADSLAQAMYEMLTDTELRSGMVLRGLNYVSSNGWQCKKGEYLALVDRLCAGRKRVERSANSRFSRHAS